MRTSLLARLVHAEAVWARELERLHPRPCTGCGAIDPSTGAGACFPRTALDLPGGECLWWCQGCNGWYVSELEDRPEGGCHARRARPGKCPV